MTNSFSTEISDRICAHMNDDHADAIVLYARVFGGAANAIAARLERIDAQGMDLTVQTESETTPVRITFDHQLKDSEDAHHTLIEMVKQARKQSI
ncbi:MAG: DUF2470 domain-containing protein [Leptolyngbyaceae cyanobacterium SM1_3_5]|nr:DUF2470 domain-containing protein [Leptolyngbyaceae cyanobacterium SM1_3_5]